MCVQYLVATEVPKSVPFRSCELVFLAQGSPLAQVVLAPELRTVQGSAGLILDCRC